MNKHKESESPARDRAHQAQSDLGNAIILQSWGLFLFVHVLYNHYNGGNVPSTSYLQALIGLVLFFRAKGQQLFLASVFLAGVDAWFQLPASSNHTMLKLFVLLGLICALIEASFSKHNNWPDRLSVTARFLLCGLYFFGVFHKLNSDFFDPTVSCAVALWASFPFAIEMVKQEYVQQLLIYGVLIVESIILIGLMAPKTRRTAIMVGIALHSLIVLSNFDNYIAFSTLSIFLHICSLPRSARANLSERVGFSNQQGRAAQARYSYALCVWFISLSLATTYLNTSFYGALWLLWVAWLVTNIGKTRVAPPTTTASGSMKWISVTSLTIGLLFFCNNWAPYTGWKNAQSMNMFANLIYEDGVSNHLIMSPYKVLFPYLNDTVDIVNVSGNPELSLVQNAKARLAYIDFLRLVRDRNGTVVTYDRNGRRFVDMAEVDLRDEMREHLPSDWVLKLQTFRPITLESPKACTSYN